MTPLLDYHWQALILNVVFYNNGLLSMQIPRAKFNIGQVVKHKHYGFHGVIFEVDFEYSLDENWYHEACKAMHSIGQPPIDKNQPFYHILTDGSEHESYVSEQNLEQADTNLPVQHEAIDQWFTVGSGQYKPRFSIN
ncbi:MAG: heat shock protein HspQ [Gammaproteobacteria bacterium]|jgi:heat shock protein HspQ|nr:heat shock protein HspQ [Gammaproteobacteria bacterium]